MEKYNLFVQTKYGKIEIAKVINDKLTHYQVIQEIGEPSVGDLVIGTIEKRVNSMGAFFANIGSNKNVLLKDNQIPAPLANKVKVGYRFIGQVSKEGFHDKVPQITLNIEIKGQCFVYKPYEKGLFFSKKITGQLSEEKRSFISEHYKNLSGGLIARSSVLDGSENALAEEMSALSEMWEMKKKEAENTRRNRTLTSIEENLIQSLNKLNSGTLNQIYVDQAIYGNLLKIKFKDEFITLHLSKKSLFEHFQINKDLEEALNPVFCLENGTSITIHELEAATFIDINSGHLNSSSSTESHSRLVNLSVIPELVRQIGLRNLSGVVFIDFLNMKNIKAKEEIICTLEEAFKGDYVQTRIHGFTKLGFMEISRTREGKRISEVLTQPCEICGGNSKVKSDFVLMKSLVDELNHLLDQSALQYEILLSENIFSLLKETIELSNYPYCFKIDNNKLHTYHIGVKME